MTKPFFSIIIPTLNEEKYLPLLLKDISKQGYKNFEVIVVDGHSEDRTQVHATNAKKSLSQALTILSSTQRNVAFQRNLGASQAKGKYYIFFDADSRIPKYFLEGIKYRISVNNPDVFTAWTDQDGSNSADKPIVTLINLILESHRLTKSPLMAVGAFLGCKQTTFQLIKGFNPTISYAEDKEFVQRATRMKAKFFVFKDPRFTFSLRRFRKEGTLRLARKHAQLFLDYIAHGFPQNSQKVYPMLGGGFYKKNKPHPWLLVVGEELVKKVKKHSHIKKLKSLLEKLLPY